MIDGELLQSSRIEEKEIKERKKEVIMSAQKEK